MRDGGQLPQEPLRDELEYVPTCERDLSPAELELQFTRLMGTIAKQMPDGSARAQVMHHLGRAYEWAARYL